MKALVYFMGVSFRNMLRAPFKHFLAILTVAICFFLVGLCYLSFIQIKRITHSQKDAQLIHVYFKSPLDQKAQENFRISFCAQVWVKTCQYIDQAQAKKIFLSQYPDMQASLNVLEENPLPPSIDIRLQRLIPDKLNFQAWAERIKTSPGILSFQDGGATFRRVMDLIRFMDQVMIFLLLGVAMMVSGLVYNTVSLLMIFETDRISIMQLVGATPRMLRWPVVLSGAFYGLVGSLIALGSLTMLFKKFNAYVAQHFSDLFLEPFEFLSLNQQVLYVGFATLICLLGAWLGVNRALKHTKVR